MMKKANGIMARSVSFVSCIACVAAIQTQQQPSALTDFSCVYFMHVPKTGGTTMRTVLQVFVKHRAQRVQLCYGTNCSDPVAERIVAQARTGPLSGTIENSLLQDRCATNKIVYGHDVNAQLVETMNLPGAGSAWIVMIREPMSWAMSLYKQAYGVHAFEGSFDDWVQSGRADMTWANTILSIPQYTEALVQKWNEWVKKTQPLILLTEEYSASISKFAKLVGATPKEKQEMLAAAVSHSNERPETEYNTTLSQDSLMKLKMLLKPTEQIYQNIVGNSEAEKRKKRVNIEADKNESKTMRITISSTWQDDEE